MLLAWPSGAAFTEKSGMYVNFEGRVQQTRSAVPMVGDAREDWKILRALSEVMGKQLPYDTLQGVRSRLAEVAPHFAVVNQPQQTVWLNGEYYKGLSATLTKAVETTMLKTPIANFFMTDAISRASQTMAKCIQARQSS